MPALTLKLQFKSTFENNIIHMLAMTPTSSIVSPLDALVAVAWSPNAAEPTRWIQADFGAMYIFYEIATQGSGDSENFVLSYYVSYSRDGAMWHNITTQYVVFMEHQQAIVTNQLPDGIYGRFVRLYLDTFYTYGSIRWGVIGGKDIISHSFCKLKYYGIILAS